MSDEKKYTSRKNIAQTLFVALLLINPAALSGFVPTTSSPTSRKRPSSLPFADKPSPDPISNFFYANQISDNELIDASDTLAIWPALNAAAAKGDYQTIQRLLSKSVVPLGTMGGAPLIYAMGIGCLPCVELLVEHGADIMPVIKESDTKLLEVLNEYIAQGYPAIKKYINRMLDAVKHVKEGNVSGLQKLLAKGIYVDVVYERQTLLGLSVKYNQLKCAEKLLAAGASLNKIKLTALVHAVKHNFQEILLWLSAQDNQSIAADIMFVAREENALGLMTKMLGQKISPDIRDPMDRTLLMMAANSRQNAIVVLLLKYQADVTKQDKQGYTALHLAVGPKRGKIERASLAILETLIEHGAEIDAPDNEGMTPLMEAARVGDFEAARFLINSGAKINIKSNAQKTAFEYSRDFHNSALWDLFIKTGKISKRDLQQIFQQAEADAAKDFSDYLKTVLKSYKVLKGTGEIKPEISAGPSFFTGEWKQTGVLALLVLAIVLYSIYKLNKSKVTKEEEISKDKNADKEDAISDTSSTKYPGQPSISELKKPAETKRIPIKLLNDLTVIKSEIEKFKRKIKLISAKSIPDDLNQMAVDIEEERSRLVDICTQIISDLEQPVNSKSISDAQKKYQMLQKDFENLEENYQNLLQKINTLESITDLNNQLNEKIKQINTGSPPAITSDIGLSALIRVINELAIFTDSLTKKAHASSVLSQLREFQSMLQDYEKRIGQLNRGSSDGSISELRNSILNLNIPNINIAIKKATGIITKTGIVSPEETKDDVSKFLESSENQMRERKKSRSFSQTETLTSGSAPPAASTSRAPRSIVKKQEKKKKQNPLKKAAVRMEYEVENNRFTNTLKSQAFIIDQTQSTLTHGEFFNAYKQICRQAMLGIMLLFSKDLFNLKGLSKKLKDDCGSIHVNINHFRGLLDGISSPEQVAAAFELFCREIQDLKLSQDPKKVGVFAGLNNAIFNKLLIHRNYFTSDKRLHIPSKEESTFPVLLDNFNRSLKNLRAHKKIAMNPVIELIVIMAHDYIKAIGSDQYIFGSIDMEESEYAFKNSVDSLSVARLEGSRLRHSVAGKSYAERLYAIFQDLIEKDSKEIFEAKLESTPTQVPPGMAQLARDVSKFSSSPFSGPRTSTDSTSSSSSASGISSEAVTSSELNPALFKYE